MKSHQFAEAEMVQRKILHVMELSKVLFVNFFPLLFINFLVNDDACNLIKYEY